jgi:2-polyprenyl-6-methoxyphenol hydroxylase-like FAD-dependent oxidoreductase
MRIAIIGAGLGGLATAIALRRIAGVAPVVYEAHPGAADGVGAAVNIGPNGMRALGELGLQGAVARGGRVLRRWTMGRKNGDVLTQFPLRLEHQYGHPMVAVRRDLLMRLLLSEAEGSGARVRFDKRLLGLEQCGGAVRLHFGDGSSSEADFVVACDGVHSRARTLLFGEQPFVFHGQGQSFGISRPGDQYELMRDRFDVTFGEDGYVGSYDIGRGHVLWFAGYEVKRTPAMSSPRSWDLTADHPMAAVERRIAGWHPMIAGILRGTITYCARGIGEMRPLERWHSGRVVLSGDAAHAMALHFGQGANMALEDAVVLALLVRRHADGGAPPHEWIERAFEAFGRLRRPRCKEVAEHSRRMGERNHRTSLLMRSIRDLAIKRMGPRIMDSASRIYGYDCREAVASLHGGARP